MNKTQSAETKVVESYLLSLPLPSLESLGLLLEKGVVPPGRDRRDVDISSLNDLDVAKGLVITDHALATTNSIKTGFIEVQNAILTPFGFVVTDNRIIVDGQSGPVHWTSGKASPSHTADLLAKNFIHHVDPFKDKATISTPKNITVIEKPVFIFNSRPGCVNFGHFVHDILLQIPTFLDCCGAQVEGLAVMPLMIGHGFRYEVMRNVFSDLTRLPYDGVVFNEWKYLHLKRAFVPCVHFSPDDNAIARSATGRLRQLIVECYGNHLSRDLRRLYISRGDATRVSEREPRFLNEGAFEEALEKLRVRSVKVGELSFKEYIHTFVNSELILGIHGAGLMNIVFSAAPRLLEIVSHGFPAWSSIKLFCETGLGAPYAKIRQNKPDNSDQFEFDIPLITASIEEILAS